MARRYPLSFSLEGTWERVRAGDNKAWRELIHHFQALVYSLATRAGLSSAEAADCFQHTWIALYEHRHNIQDSRRLPGWIVTTVRREAFRRKKTGSRQVSFDDISEPESGLLDPSEEMELVEQQHYLQSGLSRLDERCQSLLRSLFYEEEEATYEGLAKEHRLSINAIGPLRKRCLGRLKTLLEEEGFELQKQNIQGSIPLNKNLSARKKQHATLSDSEPRTAAGLAKSARRTGYGKNRKK
jgi:RNA polymerase sigma factor (sigma-70 family)